MQNSLFTPTLFIDMNERNLQSINVIKPAEHVVYRVIKSFVLTNALSLFSVIMADCVCILFVKFVRCHIFGEF
jgi:hypothetical protein